VELARIAGATVLTLPAAGAIVAPFVNSGHRHPWR
jgi:hypothetical protein